MKFSYPKPKGVDIELAFETKVLKLKSLHYGMWKNGEKLTLENLRRAQRRYTEFLIRNIPKGVKDVLDVGSGIGDNAQAFSEQGCRVVAVSPDPNHEKVFRKITRRNHSIKFVLSKYEDLSLDKKFDMVLMSESSNYFPIEVGLKQTVKFLKPHGYLLISGLFRRGKTKTYEVMNTLPEYKKCAKKYGLTLLKEEDVTKRVSPTLALGNRYFSEYAKPSIEILTSFYNDAFSFKARLISLFFQKEIRLIKDAFLEVIPERLDIKKFEKYVTYRLLLFKL